MEKPKVPAGLKRCRKCGHYKGRCVQDGKEWGITCNCNPNICSRCNTPLHEHRIGTNEYNEHDGRCYHVGFVCALMHKCPKKPAPTPSKRSALDDVYLKDGLGLTEKEMQELERSARGREQDSLKPEEYKPSSINKLLEKARRDSEKMQVSLGISAEDSHNLLAFYQKWVRKPDEMAVLSLEQQISEMKQLMDSGQVSLEGLRKTKLI